MKMARGSCSMDHPHLLYSLSKMLIPRGTSTQTLDFPVVEPLSSVARGCEPPTQEVVAGVMADDGCPVLRHGDVRSCWAVFVCIVRLLIGRARKTDQPRR